MAAPLITNVKSFSTVEISANIQGALSQFQFGNITSDHLPRSADSFSNECLVSITTFVHITRVCVFLEGSLYFLFDTNLTMTVLWLTYASASTDRIKTLGPVIPFKILPAQACTCTHAGNHKLIPDVKIMQ